MRSGAGQIAIVWKEKVSFEKPCTGELVSKMLHGILLMRKSIKTLKETNLFLDDNLLS